MVRALIESEGGGGSGWRAEGDGGDEGGGEGEGWTHRKCTC